MPPVADYFRLVREVCNRHGVLFIADEVMCGMGRTGSLFVSTQEQVQPDILCIAKGLGAGYQPIGAAVVSEEIVRTLREGSGFFQHGHTYLGHATACAAALAVQQQIESRQLLSRVVTMGRKLHAGLQSELGDLPWVGDIRGRGLFRGIELVRDRDTKAPFDSQLKVHARIKAKAMELGLMCYPMGGTVNGRDGDHILLAPPFIIEDCHVDEIVGRLAETIRSVMRSI